MNDTTTPNTEIDATQPAFSWKKPEKYWPKQDYYKDLVMSYSAMTDIVNPKAIECDFGDVRSLDSCMLEQSVLLNDITQKMLANVFMNDGSVIEKRLLNALKVQHAFRESYRNANNVMTTRYIASTRAL